MSCCDCEAWGIRVFHFPSGSGGFELDFDEVAAQTCYVAVTCFVWCEGDFHCFLVAACKIDGSCDNCKVAVEPEADIFSYFNYD